MNLLEKELQSRMEKVVSVESKMDKTLSKINSGLESAVAEKDRLLLE